MNRLDKLRRFVTKLDLGIEIAPYFNPIVPKAEGYNVLILDVFDTATLREKAKEDPNIDNERIAKIEDVDLVTDASRLTNLVESEGLANKMHYIVSSHNFEHLPDPISFLQGCSGALLPGGVLSMAIPDCRACFDHFRMPTRLSDWLGAYHGAHKQPSPEVCFDFASNNAQYDLTEQSFIPNRNLKSVYLNYLSQIEKPGPYQDTHCSVVFGQSLELMLRDLMYLGLIDFEIVEISETSGIEFFVHLRKVNSQEKDTTTLQSDDAFFKRRFELMKQVNASFNDRGSKIIRKEKWVTWIGRKVFGDAIIRNISAINARRRAKRKRQSQ